MPFGSLMFAYVGPGGALSAIGSFLALIAALLFAVVGFLWYPIKRLLRALGLGEPPALPPPSQRDLQR